jgi:hypothetical protein
MSYSFFLNGMSDENVRASQKEQLGMNIDTQMVQPSPELPSGTVTFLFTDIEGSKELM